MLVRANTPVVLSAAATARWYVGFVRDPLRVMMQTRAKYGPFVQLPHPGLPGAAPRTFLIAIGPSFNREVLGNPQTWRPVSITAGARKGTAARRLTLGIIKMTGRQHEHYRQLLVPPLH